MRICWSSFYLSGYSIAPAAQHLLNHRQPSLGHITRIHGATSENSCLLVLCFGQRQGESGLAVYECGVEHRHWHVVLVKQHADLRATENQAVGSTLNKAFCDRNVSRLAVREHDIAA